MIKLIVRFSDLILAALLAIGGVWLPMHQNVTLDAGAIGALSGALFGGAAILLGNWINRRNDGLRAAEDAERRRIAVTTIVVAELVNAATGYLNSKELVDAARTSADAGGSVPNRVDLRAYTPRGMPFTDRLGIDLLLLPKSAIDSLVTLRANLERTRLAMERISEGTESFGRLQIASLQDVIRWDIGELATAFERLAPERKLLLPGRSEPEAAVSILRRLSR